MHNTTPHPDADALPGDLAKLGEMIRDIRVALLTTADTARRLHTRPVQTLAVEDDGTLWFFTDWNSPKVQELSMAMHVSLGYANPAKHVYAAVSGSGSLLRDVRKARELWSVEQRAYYPDGPEDERLALLRVDVERADRPQPAGTISGRRWHPSRSAKPCGSRPRSPSAPHPRP